MATRYQQHEDMIAKIDKTINYLKDELNTLRAGKANPAILDKVMVEYYGTPTPLKAVANISVPDPRQLLISPFDPKSIPDVEKAINIANIGINLVFCRIVRLVCDITQHFIR